MTLLRCQGLVKKYGGNAVVDGVDLYVDPGEIVGLLGPNGAGKTTSFRMTCGIVTPTAGKIELNGVDVTNWPMYRRAQYGMGYLPQEHSIFVSLTVEQNILAVLELLGVSRTERREITDELLEQFGLSEKRTRIASTLSGGEKRRLEIARCLASEPQIILLDEPFTGIDPKTIDAIQQIIIELRASGIAILLTDHRERETLTITDRTYIIHSGKVLVSGNFEEVLDNEEAKHGYFGPGLDKDSIRLRREQLFGNRRPLSFAA